MDRWMDTQMDGWMNEWIDTGWMAGWMDAWTYTGIAGCSITLYLMSTYVLNSAMPL